MFMIELGTRWTVAGSHENDTLILDDYYSASWTERFDDVGEAHLELPISYWPLALHARNYPNGHYLHFSESDRVMNLESSRVVMKKDEPRVILNYRGVENLLSFRRVTIGPMGWIWAPKANYKKTLFDLIKYELNDSSLLQYLSLVKDPAVADEWLRVDNLDFQVGDTVLDAVKASCSRKSPFRQRHGFKLVTDGDQRNHWTLSLIPVIAPPTIPDFTDAIESLEFGISTSEYANAAFVIVPKTEEMKTPGSPVYNDYRVVGTTTYRTPTYNESNVHHWNRVEKVIKYTVDGMGYQEAMATLSRADDIWSQIGTPNDDGMAKRIIQSQSKIKTVATTPATISDRLKYGKDYELGTLFTWVPYADKSDIRAARFLEVPPMEALVAEYTWTFDQNGVKGTPGLRM